MDTRKLTGRAAILAAAIAVSTMPSFAETAVWGSNAAGNLSDSAKWADGYVPQAGDTLDFKNVTQSREIQVDITDGRRFATMTNFSYAVFRADNANYGNHLNFENIYCGNSSQFYLGSGAYLDVSGKVVFSGNNGSFIQSVGATPVSIGEFRFNGSNGSVVAFARNAGDSRLIVEKFTQSGSGYLNISAVSNQYMQNYTIGSGGFTFGDSPNARYYRIGGSSKHSHLVRLDPSADYCFERNESRSDNMGLSLDGKNMTLEIGTTDYEDKTTPRTIEFKGGVGSWNTSAGSKIVVDGNGTVIFNSRGGDGYLQGVEVKDTATLHLRDTAIANKGAIALASGTTLKIEQTSASGTVAKSSGAVTLEDGACLSFVLAEGSAAPLLNAAGGLTLPAEGTVNVKTAAGGGSFAKGNYTLVSGAGLAAEDIAKFTMNAKISKEWRGALSVVNGDLVLTVKPKPGFMIIVW